jgi:UDP-2,4-diacetamido-2,4,6-trideoxy-beta-L-altropyranose hydrolase
LKIAFRVDASCRIGTGHVARCVTLATALRSQGAEVVFICRNHPGQLAALIEAAGFRISQLPTPPRSTSEADDYAAWLGTTEQADADQTISALFGAIVDWMVVDHYALGERWERAIRPRAKNILVIDDLANRAHACDMLLDQNYGADAYGRYAGLLPPACRSMLGPRYAMLNSAFLRQTPRVRRRVERVLVYFGGMDGGNATGLALEALSVPGLTELFVNVVIGAQNPHREAISALAASRGNTIVHNSLPHLADLMAQADLAIGAAGTTTWERLCLGLPSIVFVLAANQQPGAEALAADGIIDYVGPLDTVTADMLRVRIRRLLDGPDEIERLSRAGPLVVDGLGAERVAEIMMPSAANTLRLRPAAPTDAGVLFGWANEPEVRRQSLKGEPIGWADHVAWFGSRVGSRRCHIFILETPVGLPVGQIRFDLRDDGGMRLSYLLDPLARGRRWAARLVRLGIEALSERGDFEIRAEVKAENTVSRKVFEQLGFGMTVAKNGLCIYTAAIRDFGRIE